MGALRISRFVLSCIPIAAAAHASCGGTANTIATGPDASASSGSGSASGGSSSGTGVSGSTSGGTSNSSSSGARSNSGSSGVASSSSGGPDDGGSDASEDQTSGSSSGSNEAGGNTAGASVLEHHNSPTRNGVYVDAALTKAAVPGMHRDMGFNPKLTGDILAQPLFVDGGATGKDMILVGTEENWVYALDTTGMTLWGRQLDAPAPGASLHCGFSPVGITGTPVVDLASRTMYVDAMVNPAKHMVYALSIDTGDTLPGWPLDVVATFPSFQSSVQSERGGLALAAGMVWVPYGGMAGDCGVTPNGPFYRGTVLSIPVANPAGAKMWATTSIKSGAWAGGGIASDGTSMYVATGNGGGGATWSGSEAVIRFKAADGAAFSGTGADYFAPTNWSALDGMDGDVGSSNPVVVNLPNNDPSTLVFQIGKPTTAWLLDPTNLGGVGGALVSLANATSGQTLTAPVSYTTPKATYVAFKGPCPTGGAVTAIKITPGNPPAMAHAWCAQQGGSGSLAVSTTDGQSNFLVWAFGGGRLYAFDGDSGAVVYNGGNGTDGFNGVPLFQTPMIAKGYVYVGTTGGQLVRFH